MTCDTRVRIRYAICSVCGMPIFPGHKDLRSATTGRAVCTVRCGQHIVEQQDRRNTTAGTLRVTAELDHLRGLLREAFEFIETYPVDCDQCGGRREVNERESILSRIAAEVDGEPTPMPEKTVTLYKCDMCGNEEPCEFRCGDPETSPPTDCPIRVPYPSWNETSYRAALEQAYEDIMTDAHYRVSCRGGEVSRWREELTAGEAKVVRDFERLLDRKGFDHAVRTLADVLRKRRKGRCDDAGT